MLAVVVLCMWTAILLTLLAFYLLPTIIAALMRVPGFWVIFAVNLFLGWTIAGWAVAMSWVLQRMGVIGQDRAPRLVLAPRDAWTRRA